MQFDDLQEQIKKAVNDRFTNIFFLSAQNRMPRCPQHGHSMITSSLMRNITIRLWVLLSSCSGLVSFFCISTLHLWQTVLSSLKGCIWVVYIGLRIPDYFG